MLHEALRLIRVFHDTSQKDLAKRLGISSSHLSEIEKGKKKPSLELLERYAEVFRMPLSSILFFSESVGDNRRSERVRAAVSAKIIKILDWLASREDLKVAEEDPAREAETCPRHRETV